MPWVNKEVEAELVPIGPPDLTEELYQAVLFAYNKALDQIFYVGVVLSCLRLVGVLGLEWISVKERKVKDSGNA